MVFSSSLNVTIMVVGSCPYLGIISSPTYLESLVSSSPSTEPRRCRPQPQLHFRPRFRPPEHVARVRVMDTWRRLIKFQGTFGDATKINDKETLDMVPFIVRVDKICGDYCYFCPNL